MIPQETEKYIVKYLTNQATLSELDELALWLEKPTNEKIFLNYIKTNYAINYNMKKFDINRSKKELLDYINKENKQCQLQKRQQIFKYVVAAAIVLFISLTFIFNKDNTEISKPIIVNNNIKTGKDKAVLTLENGTDIPIENGQINIRENITSNGKELIYNTQKSNQTEIIYNYLTIPRGGQYFVKLSDGTRVWLNSESKLKYPISFIVGEVRQVELVYGEAYFDVSPSENHNGMSFKVNHDKQEVEVLGTEFNIKAYKDETNIYTTLVEGKVLVSNEMVKQNLLPNEQSNISRYNRDIAVNTVDVYKEIAWKEGVFSFRRKSLGEIMKVLSRWYDIDVVFAKENLENQRFNGTLGKNQSIVDILSAIKNTNIIGNYEINNRTVILK